MLSFLKKPETEIFEPAQDAADLKIRNLIKPWNGEAADIGLVGVPCDEAVVAGGGRAGAKDGPTAIREALKHFGTTSFFEPGIDIHSLKMVDCGDVEIVPGNTRETHDRLTTVIRELLKRNIFPVTLGGGHDLSFATIRALAEASGQEVGGINVDAHFDVRPVKDGVITSGTPFRRALEELDGRFSATRFVEVGMTGNSNSKEHYDYLKKIGSHIFTLNKVHQGSAQALMDRILVLAGKNAFFSLDMDAVQQAFAPGCSAPAPVGLYPEDITAMAFKAGRAPAIKIFDLVELNPRYDMDGRTARLAAAALSCFFSGFALRRS